MTSYIEVTLEKLWGEEERTKPTSAEMKGDSGIESKQK